MEHLSKKFHGQYKIVDEVPPVYDRAVKEFGVSWDNCCFAYAPNIHIKGGKIRDKDLLEHELVHIRQQLNYSGGSEAWWERYFDDEEFRLDQELEAYRHQYKYVVAHYPRHSHWTCLRWYASCLIRIYGLKGMSEAEAMNLIKKN